jgi:hypothetical protein
MTEDQDHRLSDLLRAEAPPARDPAFRLKVLERRERRQFQRTSFTILAGALVIVLVAALGIRIGGMALQNGASLIVVAAFASAWLAFRGRLLRVLRRFSL